MIFWLYNIKQTVAAILKLVHCTVFYYMHKIHLPVPPDSSTSHWFCLIYLRKLILKKPQKKQHLKLKCKRIKTKIFLVCLLAESPLQNSAFQIEKQIESKKKINNASLLKKKQTK